MSNLKNNILILGCGGREHALAWCISRSEKVGKIYCCPGNAGTSDFSENISIALDDFLSLENFAKDNKIDLTIVGPEAPLANGIVDYFQKKGLLIFGPCKVAAEIESSKAFSKEFMRKHNIPTADFRLFLRNEYEQICDYIKNINYPIVIKADGLAAGKGVIVCANQSEALSAVNDIINNDIFGSAGNKIVIEEYLDGEEASLLVITDGEYYISLPAAQDHKRIFDNDRGKNTGGMGSYAPARIITNEIKLRIEKEIIEPTLEGMVEEGRKYTGCLYCGLMLTTNGPKVIEYNCRFGDPETQVILPLIKSDLFDLLFLSSTNRLSEYKIDLLDSTAVCIVLASSGYPDKYETGKEIHGLENLKVHENVMAFHAGTKNEGNKISSSGGRVLGITAIGKSNNLSGTIEEAYKYVQMINFEGSYYRKDIGKKGLRY